MWFLIQNESENNGYVYDIANAQYPVNPDMGLFWVEGAEGVAQRGDKYIDGQFVPRFSLDERRQMRVVQLEQKRDDVINSGIIVNGNSYFTDDKSINLMHQAITMQGLGIETVFPRAWILSDGSVVTVSFDDMKAVAVAIAGKKDACYANYLAIVPQIMASDNPESVDIDSGWPA
jgi:hypothetical protein